MHCLQFIIDSAIFVRDLFDAVLYKLYMPGAPPPPRPAPPSLHVVNAPSAPSYNNFDMAGIPTAPNGSKKRAFADRGDADTQMGRMDPDVNGRAFKQARRNNNMAPGGHYDSFGNYRLPQPARGPSMPQGYPAMPQLPPGMPPLDPNDPMAAVMAMQAMGFQFPGMPGFNPNAPAAPLSSPGARSGPGQRKMPRCRDYDTKGFCARGNSCKFEHGQESIYVPPGAGDEYDPTNSSLMLGVEVPPITSRPPPIAFNPNPFSGAERGRGRGRGQFSDRGGPGGVPGRRGGRAEFSSDRPNSDRSNTTIVVENIPEEKFSEEAVREFFSEFGNILGVNMKPYKRLAIVKYDQWEAAQAAYNSPKVIFDNRFVKVYWFKDEASLPQPPSADFAKPPSSASHFDTAATATPEPRIDIEEFARKQADLQRVHEEKMKKKKEMEEARETMQKRQEDLLKRQAEEKRRLMEKLAAKEGKPTSAEGEGEGKPLSQAETLKKQLAALEAEARSLGIDPQQAEEGSSWSVRGGRGRGRGAFRARGAYAPRGFPARGGYRGRGAPGFATGGNAYKLDNRTKKVGISGVDFTDAEKDESLRQYLLVSPHFYHLSLHISYFSLLPIALSHFRNSVDRNRASVNTHPSKQRPTARQSRSMTALQQRSSCTGLATANYRASGRWS